MTKTHLTKRESDVMEIFWSHDEDLSARDIQQYLQEVTVNPAGPEAASGQGVYPYCRLFAEHQDADAGISPDCKQGPALHLHD